MLFSHFRSFHLVALLALSAHYHMASAQDTAEVTPGNAGTHFHANGGRPLKNLMVSLAGEHGLAIDYEDAPYQASSAFEDTAVPQWRLEHGKGWMSLKARTFDLQTPLPLDESIDHAGSILSQIVEQYNANSNPDSFQLVTETPKRLSVVGIAARNDNGTLVPQEPVLSLPIQISSVQQTVSEALETLTQQLTQVSGHLVGVGTVPQNLFHTTSCVPPAGVHPARYDLTSILDAAPVKLVWGLLYDINSDSYALNIMVVSHYSIASDGGRSLVTVKNP